MNGDFYHEFPRAEYEARLDRIQGLMAVEGIDLLLITDEANYRYITGHYSETWTNRARPIAAVAVRRSPVPSAFRRIPNVLAWSART